MNVAQASCLFLSSFLSACESLPPIEFNNIEADETEARRRNPELATLLEQRAIPQDDRFHFAGDAKRLHDRQTGEAIGWQIDLSVKLAWPRVLPSPCPTCHTDDAGQLWKDGKRIAR